MKKRRVLKELLSFIMLTVGAIFAAIGLEEFLIRNLILDGGINGISIMLNNFTGLSVSFFIIILNLPFLIIGYKNMGKEFFIKAIYAMIVFTVFLEVFSAREQVTYDIILATVYGGIVLGIGVGLVLRAGGCLDGTETAAILISKKTNFSVGQIVLAFNLVIYAIAGMLYSWDRALYSLLAYFITSKVIDMISEGTEELKAVTIITNQAETISDKIYKSIGRTLTQIEGNGLINGSNTVLYVVVTRIELQTIRKILADDEIVAFASIADVTEVLGNHIKKKPKEEKKKEVVNIK